MNTGPKFTEDWFGKGKAKRLLEALRCCTGSGSIIEVGSQEGRSTIMLANQCYPELVHSIDHWQGDIGNPKMAVLAAERNVYATFIDNMNVATKGNYVVHRMSWRAVNWLELAPIKFLFIDGDHTYEEVFDNIKVALPLFCNGGVIAGDDYRKLGVEKAVRSVFGNVNHGKNSEIWYQKIDKTRIY